MWAIFLRLTRDQRREIAYNPFVNDTVELTSYERVKRKVFTYLGIPIIRILGALIIIVVVLLYVNIIMIGIENLKDKPLATWRRTLMIPVRFGVRLVMVCLGYYWINVNYPKEGLKNDGKDARVFVSNHIGLFDALYFVYAHDISIAMKAELRNAPYIGLLLTAIQAVFIERFSKEGKEAAVDQITNRIHDKRFPQLLIFPQGMI